MKFGISIFAAFASISSVALAHDGVKIEEAYALFSSSEAQSGAIFMEIENHQDQIDRLIRAETAIAERTELHTHLEEEGETGSIMRMIEVEAIEIPANGEADLERGGDHVMLLGVQQVPAIGESIELTLEFERAGIVEIEVKREEPRDGAHSHEDEHDDHSHHDH